MLDSTAILSIGSNCGDKCLHVNDCINWLKNHDKIEVLKSSDIYETPELYGTGTPYNNAVVEIITDMTIEELKEQTKIYEINAGRDCDCRRRGLVPIDVDIVIWNDDIIRPKDYMCEFFRIGYSSMRNV